MNRSSAANLAGADIWCQLQQAQLFISGNFQCADEGLLRGPVP